VKAGENINARNEETKTENPATPKYGHIKMPPKMLKCGRPKGAEVTVIGIPKTKKRKKEL